MKPEQKFQHSVLKTLKEVYHCAAYPMSTTIPGFPDALVIRRNSAILLEFKHIEYAKGEKSLKHVFQETQPPFYYEYFKHSDSRNIYCAIEAVRMKGETEVERNFLLHFVSPLDVATMRQKDVDWLFDESGIFKTRSELCDAISYELKDFE